MLGHKRARHKYSRRIGCSRPESWALLLVDIRVEYGVVLAKLGALKLAKADRECQSGRGMRQTSFLSI
ncbi:Uncharacterised protein [Vibrio cholerae]|nr:Uncharacterised protein [Vibrio cholerae]